jgi:two-component system chemotaxis response regulator CheB
MTTALPLRKVEPPIRVLLADDSAVVRGLVSRWLTTEAGIELVGMGLNGRDAVRLTLELQPDVIVLDVEMPELDGLGAIPEILKACPGVRILMASTLTHRNAEVTLKALSLGATDYLPKPVTGKLAAAADFKRDLALRIRALGARRSVARPSTTPAAAGARAAAPVARPAAPVPQLARRTNRLPADVLVIGSSTGGPQALQVVISGLAGKVQVPILIAQHMPAMFTTILADHLGKAFGAPCLEAKDGMPLLGGRIYVAPGDFHTRIARRHGALVATLDQSLQINYCRPAVDPLFASAAEHLGERVLAVVLTGMGADGREGARAIIAKGGSVLAQDEATSVVWGMPGAVAQAGLATAIKPLPEMAGTIVAFAQGKA